MDQDTDILITLVASLLKGDFNHDDILEALVQCEGNVESAAAFLDENLQVASGSGKRKTSNNLDSWVKPASKRARRSTPEGSSSPLKPISVSRPKPPSSSSSKPVEDLMRVLQPPPSSPKKSIAAKLPPLTLATPALVAQHTPCTLHHSVLPPELACELFYAMVDLAKDWKPNKWWLFDRLVESPHRTSFFARRTNGLDDNESWQETAQFWYNGRKTEVPPIFPEPMERACRIVEDLVNEQLSKRERHALEYGGSEEKTAVWRANVAASNIYEGSKENVGWHSDGLTYLGPYPTIASLSLGTSRLFSLREVIPIPEQDTRSPRTLNIPVTHNSLTIMHASCQERFKHCVPPQRSIDVYRPAYPKSPGEEIDTYNCRINITFRFYRPDFQPQTIPKCHCGVPTILRADMKRRIDGKKDKYWWTCFAGLQNEGKGCNLWKVMDMEAEGRGPCIGDFKKDKSEDIAGES